MCRICYVHRVKDKFLGSICQGTSVEKTVWEAIVIGGVQLE
jgi:hypothetical protein